MQSVKIFNKQKATSLVVANMIGTGIFATIGIQLEIVPNPMVLLVVWLLGGFYALSGALVYHRVVTEFPRSGGEYHFLTVLIHPSLGFSAGLLSIITGFGAPIALSAIAAGEYLENVIQMKATLTGSVLVASLAFIHFYRPHFGSSFHLLITILKVLIIMILIVAGFTGFQSSQISTIDDYAISDLSSISVVLVFTLFAYSGWNASCYVHDEIKGKRSMFFSLIWGTAIVTFLYLLLNLVFLGAVPLEKLSGNIDIGHILIRQVIGEGSANIVDLLIAFILVSSISAMIIVGSRVVSVMYSDFHFKSSVWTSVTTISLVALILINTFTFNQILLYTGFTLTLFITFVSIGTFRKWISGEMKLDNVEVFSLIFFLGLNIFLATYLSFTELGSTLISWVTVIVCALIYFPLKTYRR